MRGVGTSPGCAGWTRETEYMRRRGLPCRDWLEKGNNTSECMTRRDGWGVIGKESIPGTLNGYLCRSN